MLKSKKGNVLLIILLLILGVGSWRLAGCGGPLIPGDNDNQPTANNNNQAKQTDDTKKRLPPIPAELPKTPIKIKWTKAPQDAERFHYVLWQNKPMVWFAQKEESKRREVFAREIVGDTQIGFKDRGSLPGQLEDVAVHNSKMHVVNTWKGTRTLQVGQAQADDSLKWFTVRSFRAGEYDEAKHIAFLGNTMIFYGKNNIYSLDPNSKDEPKLFKYPANIFPNVNYMKCSHGFCIALVNNRLPLMFGPTGQWSSVPKFISWVTLPTKDYYPFAGETKEKSEEYDKKFADIVKQEDIYLRDRLAVNDQQTAFSLRDHYVFWTCKLGTSAIEYRQSVEKIRSVTWADNDLLLVFTKRIVLMHKNAVNEIPLPAELSGKSFELQRLNYKGTMLFLEVTMKGQKEGVRSLFVAPYKPITNFAVCSK